MGARGDFVKAMLFGVVIGVASTTAFFQLRGGPAAPECPKPPPPPAPKPTVKLEPTSPRTRALIDQLAKSSVTFEPTQVSCTTNCCTISVDDVTYDEHADAIKAALEITPGTPWQSKKAGSIRIIEKCW
jgi:hypothetical protein